VDLHSLILALLFPSSHSVGSRKIRSFEPLAYHLRRKVNGAAKAAENAEGQACELAAGRHPSPPLHSERRWWVPALTQSDYCRRNRGYTAEITALLI
jgi:hypothetical protein